MNEKSLKNKIRNELKQLSKFVYCPNDSATAGIPDILTVINGRSVAIELKLSKDVRKNKAYLHHNLTAKQSKALRDIGYSGGIALLVVGLDSLSELAYSSYEDLKPGEKKVLEFKDKYNSIEEVLSCVMSLE